jgi:hypothetical protein
LSLESPSTDYLEGTIMSRYSTLRQLAANEILRDVYTRLLKTSTLSAAAVRALGVDPKTPNLIHVTNLMGRQRYPAFQFGEEGVKPLVLELNCVLLANEDPLGVWDWWVGMHARLSDDQAPVDLLTDPTQENWLRLLADDVLTDEGY